jgi:hypothetical protein
MKLTHSKSLLALSAFAVLCFATSVQSQTIRWVGMVSEPSRSDMLHAPDNRLTTVGVVGGITVKDFGPVMRYSGLAALLGVPESVLARADIIAFEGNGGGGAGVEGGWESSKWTFTDGSNKYVAKFNEKVGKSSDASVIANGCIKGADGKCTSGGNAYRAFFGVCSPDPQGLVVSYILFDLHSVRPAINTTSSKFAITIENLPGGSFGEGTPDPDAIGVFTACPSKRP